MTFLSAKKPPFEKTTSLNDKTKGFLLQAKEIIGIFDQNNGLTP